MCVSDRRSLTFWFLFSLIGKIFVLVQMVKKHQNIFYQISAVFLMFFPFLLGIEELVKKKVFPRQKVFKIHFRRQKSKMIQFCPLRVVQIRLRQYTEINKKLEHDIKKH